MPSIVTINVSQTTAPLPSTLQKKGAIISQGGTTLGVGSYAFLTQASDLTALLPAPAGLNSVSWSGGVVTATPSAPIPGLQVGDTFRTTIAACSPAGYNGLVTATVTGAQSFTYPLAVNPGTAVAVGTYTLPSVAGLTAKVNTFYSQGAGQGVYVLELGAGDAATGPASLGTWIQSNPQTFYAYDCPGGWDASSGFLALLAQYEALNSKTYFFINSTLATYASYTAQMKCLFWLIPSTAAPLTESSVSAAFQHALQYAPSSTNRMTPMAFSFLFGVTPYPQQGNNAVLTAVVAAGGNYVGTGAEGGISTAILVNGTTADGQDFTYWYSVDWIQIQSDLTISNAVINGSNNPANPLYYNQFGINTLQDNLVALAQAGVAFGLGNGTVTQTALDGPVFTTNLDDGDYPDQIVVNAVPFLIYTAENPGDYRIGKYGGLTMVWIPNRGFTQIVFNIMVTQFLSQ